MKKGIVSTTIVVCLVGLTCIFLLDFTLKFSSTTYSTNDQEEKHTRQLRTLKPRKLITCDRSDKRYDLCYLNYSTLVDPSTTTLSIVTHPSYLTSKQVEKIRPYPRKWQDFVMSGVKELTLDTISHNSTCKITHNVPALVFSAGGLTGNFFHDFYDGLIPLYITVNSLFPNRDVILVVVNCNDKWLTKYSELLHHFTTYPETINLDREKVTHCFPSAVVGLISHGPMIINPTLLPDPRIITIMDFHALLKTTYSQGYILQSKEAKLRPRLVLVSRQGTRRIVNEDEVRQAAEDIGFDVVVFEPKHGTPLREAYRVFESCHAMIGVHGAGLTNELFLRPGSVFMQIVPIGFNWLADICFGRLASRLGLEYIEYDIAVNESSLVDRYGEDSMEMNNPGAIVKGDWPKMGLYLNQDVNLDMVRFKKYLNKAYEIAKKFMLKESLAFE